MKTIVLTLLMFAGLLALTPRAEAGWRPGYYGYGRAAYGYPSYRGYYGGYHRPSYGGYYRPRAYGYYRPVRSYYYGGYDYCAPRVRYYAPAPRFSFFFGF